MRCVIAVLSCLTLLFSAACGDSSGSNDPVDTGAQDSVDEEIAGVPDLQSSDELSEDDSGPTEPEVTDKEMTPEQWYEKIDGPCSPSKRIGRFEVLWGEAILLSGDIWEFIWFDGSVADAIDALQEGSLKKEYGPCQLLQMKEGAFCDPPCDTDQQCTHGAGCVPFPVPQDVGKVTVTGLADTVEIDAPKGGLKKYSYYDFEGAPFEPGALIELVAQGKDLPGFTMHGLGVERPVFKNTQWEMKAGQPIDIEWGPSALPSSVHLWITADLHGLTPVQLHCELEDTGSFTISGEIVTEMLQYPTTIPAVHVSRHTVDSVENDKGCIEFEVASQVVGQMKFE